ncbi:glycoside hydrolase family 6 protein [Microlunatus endophyticus]|uniref:glycoside hydrolase family 6 protein n=1 Tax=Microlunatus endophyticus TaxID=1716077 RepID=UPI00402B41E1
MRRPAVALLIVLLAVVVIGGIILHAGPGAGGGAPAASASPSGNTRPTASPSPTTTPTPTPNCPDLSTPAYQRVDPKTGATMITTNAADAAKSLGSGFTRDLGQPFNVSTEPQPGLGAVHELTKHATGDRLYTANTDEITQAVDDGYRDTGIAFYAFAGQPDCGTTQIFRMVKRHRSQYPATTDARSSLAESGWSEASVAFSARLNDSWSWPTTTGKGPLDQPPYLYQHSKAWTAYQDASDASTRQLLYQIAATPTAVWLGGSPDEQAGIDAIETKAVSQHTTPEFVLYAIPKRDCGGYAAGGLGGPSAYESWIRQVRAGIAGRPTVVIAEPDAIGMSCLGTAARNDRIAMLRYAVQTLSKDPNTWVYLHAGSSQLKPAQVVPTLLQIGLQGARGLAINVSSYGSTQKEMQYGDQLLEDLAQHGVHGLHYVIDTSRNGLGRAPAGSADAAHSFCNQRGRALGQRPTPVTGNPNVDAFLWIKPPGETDGGCFPGDAASGWFQSYALDLVQRSLAHQTISELPLPR